MNKKLRLLLLSSITLSMLVACDRNVIDPSSSEPSSSSSESSSSSSESSSSSSSSEGHTHVPGATWDHDENRHWKTCTICGEPLDIANHTFDEGVVIKEPTETEDGITRYTCEICEYHYDEVIPAGDELVEMNDEINGKSFVDPFEVRDYLLAKGYNFNASLPGGKRYGYSEAHNSVVIYKDDTIYRPAECVGDNFIPYTKTTVSSYAGLASVIESLNNDLAHYNTIELSADIEQLETSPLIRYSVNKDLEINLTGHAIRANTPVNTDYRNEKYYTLQFLDTFKNARIFIHNGTIEANRVMKSGGVEDDSCCLSLVAAKSFRLNDLDLVAKNGTQCIGDMSQDILEWHDKTKKVYIDDVNMSAPLRAMSIAGGTWDIKNCSSIRGMVCIDGGTVNIDNVVVDASNCHLTDYNEYTQGYSNPQLAALAVTKINDSVLSQPQNVRDIITSYRGAMNFNDAIVVLSRRMGIYEAAKVTVENSSLTPVIVNNVVTGYGFRYWDLENTGSGEAEVPTLTNNQFPHLDSVTGFGGSNLG